MTTDQNPTPIRDDRLTGVSNPSWFVDPVMRAMGATWQYDYAVDYTGFSERLTRCYELAAKACLVLGSDVVSRLGVLPDPVGLVHGSWSSPETRDAPIGHAWVVLEDGRIWEPITAGLFDAERFSEYTDCVPMDYHSCEGVARMLVKHEHFGPWFRW